MLFRRRRGGVQHAYDRLPQRSLSSGLRTGFYTDRAAESLTRSKIGVLTDSDNYIADLYDNNKTTVSISVKNSASGTASHTPVTSKNSGNRSHAVLA